MSPPTEHRRELLEEIVRERSRVVASLGIEEDDPSPNSSLWAFGIGRLLMRASAREAGTRRSAVLAIAIVSLAWLEAIDRHK